MECQKKLIHPPSALCGVVGRDAQNLVIFSIILMAAFETTNVHSALASFYILYVSDRSQIDIGCLLIIEYIQDQSDT